MGETKWHTINAETEMSDIDKMVSGITKDPKIKEALAKAMLSEVSKLKDKTHERTQNRKKLAS